MFLPSAAAVVMLGASLAALPSHAATQSCAPVPGGSICAQEYHGGIYPEVNFPHGGFISGTWVLVNGKSYTFGYNAGCSIATSGGCAWRTVMLKVDKGTPACAILVTAARTYGPACRR